MADPRRLVVAATDDLVPLLRGAGLPQTPVLVVVGGAGGLDAEDEQRVRGLFRTAVLPAVERSGATVVDGGTHAGVMRALGDVRAAGTSSFALVGVAAVGTVAGPGAAGADPADADPNHTHLLLVPGSTWGEESPWLAEAATAVADGMPSATLLLNGGEVAWDDVRHSLAAGRPVVVLAGSGRTADAIAAAASGDPGVEERAHRVARSPLVHVVGMDRPEAVEDLLGALLSEGVSPG